MTTFKRLLGLAAANLILPLLLLELAGNILFSIEQGGVFYRRHRTLTAHEVRNNPWGTADYRPVLHPYFGFLYAARPGVAASQNLHLNDHLFLQQHGYAQKQPACCDFPAPRRESNEAIVAFFGGSVAGGIALAAQENDKLAALLRDAPRFQGRKIRVLNFAVGGHKQPQQLMILAYYLSLGQAFDAVINIDGFNEIVFGPANAEKGVAVGYPNPYQWLSLVSFLSDHRLVG
jgi:hypothetical protein